MQEIEQCLNKGSALSYIKYAYSDVSKGDKKQGYYDLVLTPEQMGKIDAAIKNNFVTPIDK